MKKNGKKRQTKKELANELNISERTLRYYQKNGKLQKILTEKRAKEIVVSLKSDAEYKAEIRTRGLILVDKILGELVEAKIDYNNIKDFELLMAKVKVIETLIKN